MFHQRLNIQQSLEVEKIEHLGAALEKIGSANLRAKMRSFFQKFAARPQMESQVGKHGRCPVFPNGVVSRSGVSGIARPTNGIFGKRLDDESKKKTFWEQFFPCSQVSISIYFGQIDLFSLWSFLSA